MSKSTSEVAVEHIAYTGEHLPEVSSSPKNTLRFSWKTRILWLGLFTLALFIAFAIVIDRMLTKVVPVMLPVKQVLVFLLREMLGAWIQ